MNIGFFFAKRYLFSKKTTHAINVISTISVIAFLVGSAALIIILSALNGFESLVSGMIGSFDPPLKITATKGKVFKLDDVKIKSLGEIEGIASVQPTLEENGVITYGDAQEIVRLKGVNKEYPNLLGLDSLVIVGNTLLEKNQADFALFGSGVGARLNVNVNGFAAANIFIPDRNKAYNALNPEGSLNMVRVQPSGIFMLQEDVEKDYVIVPIRAVRELLQYPAELSSLDVFLAPNANVDQVQRELKSQLGQQFLVENRKEQNRLIFKIFNSEKWATYLILLFILVVASFNMIGALTMLVIEKKKDVAVLQAMGYPARKIRSIFLQEGLMLAVLGGAVGLILGVTFCLLQQRYGFIPLENSVVDSYPVKVMWQDVLLVWATIVILGVLSSFYPAYNSVNTKEIKLS